MLHQDFSRRFSVERDPSGQQLVQHDAQAVDVDFSAVAAVRHFGSHVIHGPHALCLGTAVAFGDEFREADVANLDDAVLQKHIGRFEVAVHDPPVVQEAEPIRHPGQPMLHFLDRKTVEMGIEDLREALTRHVFHHDPVIAVGVLLDVKDRDEVGMLQVEALGNSPELHVEVILQKLEGHLLPGISEGIIHLPEASPVNGPLDCVAVKRLRFRLTGEFHRCPAVNRRLPKLVRQGH